MNGNIGNVNRLIPAFQQKIEGPQKEVQSDDKASFTELFDQVLNSVNSLQMDSAKAQELLATGDAADLHQVMIAAEEAGIAMDLLLEIRNRLLDAYQNLVRMPM